MTENIYVYVLEVVLLIICVGPRKYCTSVDCHLSMMARHILSLQPDVV